MILIAAGSSLPFCGFDSQHIVLRAFRAIGRIAEIERQSPLYESPAWPVPSDPAFVNAVISVTTDLGPLALLHGLHAIEAGFGRRRDAPRNAPRTLDLDLLAYDDVAMTGDETGEKVEGGLILPHPRISERAFVLAPLCDIAPDWRHPVTREVAKSMLSAVSARGMRRIS